MKVTVVRPADLGPPEAALWARFQHLTPVTLSPFLSLTFAQAVGRARPAARVAVIEDNGQVVAFLPFEPGRRRIGVPIGHPMNDLHGFLGSGAPIDARRVIRKAGLRGWRFISAPAEQAALAPHQYEGATVTCPVIDLTRGYQTFRAGLRKSASKDQERRALARNHGALRLAWNTASVADVRQMISWKSEKYGGSRQLFSDPTVLPILDDLAVTASPECTGVVSVLSAGDRLVAVDLKLLGPRGLSGWFASYDPALSRYSPGRHALLAIAEEAASRGIPQYDMGYGQDHYKFGLANDSYPVAGGAIWVARAEAVARRIYRRHVG